MIGIEMGGAVEGGYTEADTEYAPTMQLHVAPVLTLAIVSMSMRVSVPVRALGPGDRLPLEYGGAFTLKIPLRLTSSD
jgi:hypothetical protein